MIGIIFGSSMGNTEEAASFLAENLGLENELLNVANCDAAKLNGFDKLILGVSTWGTGDLQDDWDAFDFGGLKLSGKTVAIFGMGDAESYADSFCGAMGKLYDEVVKAGAYKFDESEAVRGGKFVGLPLDADNESEKTEPRISAWIEQIKPHFA